MGLLIEFYAGEKKRIVQAWKNGNVALPAEDSYVTANADFSFHLSMDDLDQLMLAASSILRATPIRFEDAIQQDLDAHSSRSEQGIHEMADAFTDLFAMIPPERTTELYDMWRASVAEPPTRPTATGMKKRFRKLRSALETGMMGIVFFPLLLCVWLFSPRFRKERAENKARHASRQGEVRALPAYTMKQAIEALIRTCQTAKSGGSKVIYTWSL